MDEIFPNYFYFECVLELLFKFYFILCLTAGAGEYCLCGKVSLESLYMAWDSSPNFHLGQRAEIMSTVDLLPCSMKVSYLYRADDQQSLLCYLSYQLKYMLCMPAIFCLKNPLAILSILYNYDICNSLLLSLCCSQTFKMRTQPSPFMFPVIQRMWLVLASTSFTQ